MSATPEGTPQPSRPKRQRLDSLKNPQPRPPPGSGRPPNQPQKARPKGCTNPECQSTNVGEEDGSVICRECGTVVSDANIVSEVQFAETGTGGHVAVGAYIGSDQAYASNGIMGLRSAGPDSRQQTESEGKRFIIMIGTALRIGQSLMDSGLSVFKLAANANFIQGRRINTVAAVSLYIACRLRENECKHMLIDFADVLNLNVFGLGHIYKSLLEELRINGNGYRVHPINPEQLIWRFSAKLEFGAKQTAVANDAVRIVQRMSRDWMTPGRRPAGICGAALIIAAGMNNFRRTVREMVYIAKVTEITLMKRLEEFTRTGSGALTVEEFRRIDLERQEDPPAFEAEKKKRGRKRKVIEIDDDGDTDPESQRATSAAPSASENPQLQTPAGTQKRARTDKQNMPPPPIPIDPQLTGSISPGQQQSEPPASEPPAKNTSKPPAKKRRGRVAKSKQPPSGPQAPSSPPTTQTVEPSIISGLLVPTSITDASAFASALPADSSDEPQPPPPPRGPIAMTEDISDSEFGPNDPEITDCLLTESERAIKERIWTHENREWLRAQAAKLLKQQLAEANGTAKPIRRRIRRRTRMGDMRAYRRGGPGDEGEDDEDNMPASGAGDAVGKMLKKRGYSRKINYEAVNKVYEPSSRASSSRRESVSQSVGSPGAGESPEPGTPDDPGAGAASPRARLSMLAPRRLSVQVTTPGGTTRRRRSSGTPKAATPAATEDTHNIPPIDITTTNNNNNNHEDEDEEGADPDDYHDDEDVEETLESLLDQARHGAGDEEEGFMEEGDYDDE